MPDVLMSSLASFSYVTYEYVCGIKESKGRSWSYCSIMHMEQSGYSMGPEWSGFRIRAAKAYL
jgi:hypothetical protein